MTTPEDTSQQWNSFSTELMISWIITECGWFPFPNKIDHRVQVTDMSGLMKCSSYTETFTRVIGTNGNHEALFDSEYRLKDAE